MAYSDDEKRKEVTRERVRRYRESQKGVTEGVTEGAKGVTFGRALQGSDVTPVTYIDLVKDLDLDLGKDLGLTGWDMNGAHLRDDITMDQVRRIRGLVEAKHGQPHRVYS